MSSRIGSVASRPTWVRRTEPIGASATSGPQPSPKYRRGPNSAHGEGPSHAGSRSGSVSCSCSELSLPTPTRRERSASAVWRCSSDPSLTRRWPAVASGRSASRWVSPWRLHPPLPPLSLSESGFSCGGQSTDVGGQLSVLPEPDDEPGGGQPAPAPKSPGVVQSAWAMPTGSSGDPPGEREGCRRDPYPGGAHSVRMSP